MTVVKCIAPENVPPSSNLMVISEPNNSLPCNFRWIFSSRNDNCNVAAEQHEWLFFVMLLLQQRKMVDRKSVKSNKSENINEKTNYVFIRYLIRTDYGTKLF